MATYKLNIAQKMSFNRFFIIRVSKVWFAGVVIPHFTWYNVDGKTQIGAFKRKQVGPQRVLTDFRTPFSAALLYRKARFVVEWADFLLMKFRRTRFCLIKTIRF